jgi:two-component system response regulator VanR
METPLSILIVDDQPEILENLALVLESEGYRALMASDGVEALDALRSHRVDLILADIAMPRMNGYQLYERVRENPEWVTVPFLFLTARAMDSDIRYGKELGVDDYLTKPIEPEDLLATIHGRLRRAQQLAQLASQPVPMASQPSPLAPQTTAALRLGQLQIDPRQHRVWIGGETVSLSAREFALLQYLAERANQVISVQELIRVTHELDTDRVEAGALLRPMIRSIRRKLGYDVGKTGCIENVRGVGYRLVAPDNV